MSDITIPASVTAIPLKAFKGCSALAVVNLKAGLETIGIEAFANCKKLSSIAIPNSVTAIKMNAFSGNTRLTSVSIGNGTRVIGRTAFHGCSALSTVIIKSTDLTTVKANAFLGINPAAAIQVRSAKLASYTRLLKGKGQGSGVSITKI